MIFMPVKTKNTRERESCRARVSKERERERQRVRQRRVAGEASVPQPERGLCLHCFALLAAGSGSWQSVRKTKKQKYKMDVHGAALKAATSI